MSSRPTRSDRGPSRRSRSLECEALEGRTLLSTIPSPDAASPRPIDVAIAARHERLAHLRASRLQPSYPMPVAHQTIDAQGKFAYDTFNRGVSMARARPVQKVGLSYAKLSVAHDTTKVGVAYLHAVVKGDGKQINDLSRTRLVHKVSNDFTTLSQSSSVKHVGDAFTKFGKAVSHQWNQYFGSKHASSKAHKH